MLIKSKIKAVLSGKIVKICKKSELVSKEIGKAAKKLLNLVLRVKIFQEGFWLCKNLSRQYGRV